jgi:hypothetical protein
VADHRAGSSVRRRPTARHADAQVPNLASGGEKRHYQNHVWRHGGQRDAGALCSRPQYDDLRRLPLSLRKTNLARILARRIDGIHLAPFEQGEIGPDLFRHACKFGLEGLVSKHRDSTYRGGRFDRWVKVKNRHPAFSRVMEAFGET